MDDNLKQKLLDVLAAWPTLSVVIVYGSAATGTMRPTSDIDLAVLGPQPLAAEIRLAIMADVTRATGRDTDVLDLQQARGTILSEILTLGVRLRVTQPAALELLMKRLVYDEADYMPLYRRLLRERRERFLHG